jgi:hypothetical protein
VRPKRSRGAQEKNRIVCTPEGRSATEVMLADPDTGGFVLLYEMPPG